MLGPGGVRGMGSLSIDLGGRSLGIRCVGSVGGRGERRGRRRRRRRMGGLLFEAELGWVWYWVSWAGGYSTLKLSLG